MSKEYKREKDELIDFQNIYQGLHFFYFQSIT